MSHTDHDMQDWTRHDLGGFTGHVGPLYTRMTDAGRLYAMRADARHLNMAGIVHGGMIATLLDQSLSAMAWDQAGRVPCVSVQLDTQFYAPVREGALMVVQGRVKHRAGSLIFVTGELSVDGKPCASAEAMIKILRPKVQQNPA
ncbi:PaaI family thioesterase [Bordetella genomosp. 13]|uniref:PaaI family thioesterase n=1 Tax=Bordetella genomosp. 13 TaxID=463040 RepID=UPI0011A966F4|nr:PaaI family thioesterase [Bordetella genomosp. 13]